MDFVLFYKLIINLLIKYSIHAYVESANHGFLLKRSLTYSKMDGPDESLLPLTPRSDEDYDLAVTPKDNMSVELHSLAEESDNSLLTLGDPSNLTPSPSHEPVSPATSCSSSSIVLTTVTNNACHTTSTTTSQRDSTLIDPDRQLADEVSSSASSAPPSPTAGDDDPGAVNVPGFSRPVKNPSELDKKVFFVVVLIYVRPKIQSLLFLKFVYSFSFFNI